MIEVEDTGARDGETEEEAEERRAKQKEKLKSQFDSLHDKTKNKNGEEEEEGGDDESGEGKKKKEEKDKDSEYLNNLKKSVEQQQQLNKVRTCSLVLSSASSLSCFSSLSVCVCHGLNFYVVWFDLQLELEGSTAEERVLLEGARTGTYVRIVLRRVPCEFITHFDLRFPIVLGGLLPSEHAVGLVQARVKRHRWHEKVLKSSDPLIFSMGWRRFQVCWLAFSSFPSFFLSCFAPLAFSCSCSFSYVCFPLFCSLLFSSLLFSSLLFSSLLFSSLLFSSSSVDSDLLYG
jgi:ribosome biogenesis protein BMS1